MKTAVLIMETQAEKQTRNIKTLFYAIFIIMISLVLTGCSRQDDELQDRIEALIGGFPAEIGVSVLFQTDTVAINAEEHFPMFSVVKFYQALAVSERIRTGQVHWTTEPGSYVVNVTAEDLKPGTWSPMREEHPEGGDFSVRQLMEYSLVNSDNNACDVLFNRFATPEQVEGCVRSWGIRECGIAWTEDEQRFDPQRAYDNWTTPGAATGLLKKFYDEHNKDDYSRFVWNTMARCNTGAARIPKYISDKSSLIVHKTGTGFILEDGTVTGINDIACIVLPDGSHFELAVFIRDAKCDVSECEEMIAVIAQECYSSISGLSGECGRFPQAVH